MASEGKRQRRADSILEAQLLNESENTITSPYTTRVVTVLIGEKQVKYTSFQAIIDQYPGLQQRLNQDGSILLEKVDENVGHTLIHYMHTGQYATLQVPGGSAKIKAAADFQTAILAYCAAVFCDIRTLEDFAKQKMEELSRAISVFELQRITEEVARSLPPKDLWFHTSMQRWVKAAFEADSSLLENGEFLETIGTSVFDKAAFKSLVEMYREKYKNGEEANTDTDDHTIEPQLVGRHSKTASIADSAIHMEETRQEPLAVPELETISDTEVQNGTVTHAESRSEVLGDEHSDTLVEELQGESNGNPGILSQIQSLPAGTDSDGETVKPKAGKKSKNKKKKKKNEAGQNYDDA